MNNTTFQFSMLFLGMMTVLGSISEPMNGMKSPGLLFFRLGMAFLFAWANVYWFPKH
jgi:hypothetical protein